MLFLGTEDPYQKVFSIGQKTGPSMNQFAAGSIEARDLGRSTSGSGNTIDRLPIRNEQDGPIPGPGASAMFGCIRKDLGSAPNNLDALESASGKETQRA